jgi:cytochrome c2
MAPKKKVAGDASKGEKVFKSQCAVCHALGAHGTGPKLGGVFGREPGTSDGFGYS